MQDYGRDAQYADASIDAMREQKMAVRRFIFVFDKELKNEILLVFLYLGITTLFNNENSFTFLIYFIILFSVCLFLFCFFSYNNSK